MNANVLRGLSEAMRAVAVPPDPDWHDDAVLISELATLNTLITRYITSALDADAKRAAPVNAAQEARLGQQLIALGQRLQARVHVHSREPTHPGSG